MPYPDFTLPRYYNATAYPDIYKHTYWGAFRGQPDSTIISNRNEFINKFGIVAFKRLSFRQHDLYVKQWLDHVEHYEDKEGRIVQIFSQTRHDTDFIPMKPLYHVYLKSGYRYFETRKSKDKVKKALTQTILSRVPDDVAQIILSYMTKKPKIAKT